MTGTELKKQLQKLVVKIGPEKTKRELAIVGAGFSTAEKLVAGTYDSDPKDRVRGYILKVLSKFGMAKFKQAS